LFSAFFLSFVHLLLFCHIVFCSLFITADKAAALSSSGVADLTSITRRSLCLGGGSLLSAVGMKQTKNQQC
jgi:hypothetical protein